MSKLNKLFAKFLAIFKMPQMLPEEIAMQDATENVDYATVLVKLNKHFDTIFNT